MSGESEFIGCFADGQEPPPVETIELLRPRTRSTERDVRSYNSILESADANFLTFKPKGKSSSTNEGGSLKNLPAVRVGLSTRLEEAVVTAVPQSPSQNIHNKELWPEASSNIILSPQPSLQSSVDSAIDVIAKTIRHSISSPAEIDNSLLTSGLCLVGLLQKCEVLGSLLGVTKLRVFVNKMILFTYPILCIQAMMGLDNAYCPNSAVLVMEKTSISLLLPKHFGNEEA
eukprot:scaffold1365_cov163-Ochromonas_danica.AAC.40